jgi:subtilisin-like proprotein convertase family protein
VDARAAVRLAEAWIAKQIGANQQVLENEHDYYYSRWDPLFAGETDSSTIMMEKGLNIEQVEVDFSADVGRLGDLTVTLVSPGGSESILLDRVGRKNTADNLPATDTGSAISGDFNYTFMSTHHRGEDSGGNWQLAVKDASNGLPVRLNSWSLRLFGNKLSANDTYFYTDEFAVQAGEQTTRSLLDDAVNGTKGGRNTLHMAAISGDIEANLATGKVKLGRARLTIRSPETIHNLISGDGDDNLIAGGGHSLLDGGQGRNILTGGAGKDLFVVRRRANGSDEIINFDASNGETIHLVGFSGLQFSELRINKRLSDVVISLPDKQRIILKNRQVDALGPQHFVFQDRFNAPASYVDSQISIETPIPAAPGQIGIVLNGGGGGVSLRGGPNGKMIASLVGKVYQREDATPSVFVVAQQEGRSDFGNAVRGFRQGIDKMPHSQLKCNKKVGHYAACKCVKNTSFGER